MEIRHDDLDPQFCDEKGFMWSRKLLLYYMELNLKDNRTDADNEIIDKIYELSIT